MEKITIFTPAYQKKGYGVGALTCHMVLKGPLGATQFVFSTGIYLPGVELSSPMGYDVGYHSPRPMYEGQTPHEDCPYLGKTCYYDGSGLKANEYLTILIREGSEVIWTKLQDYYDQLFKETT